MANALRWTTAQLDAYARRRLADASFVTELDEEEKRQVERRKRGPSVDATGCAIPRAAGKYGNVKTNGEASTKQARRLSQLRLMNEAGQIRGLARQPEYVIIPKQSREDGELLERRVTYIADFCYEEWTPSGWRLVVEDVKGFATPEYVVKRKLMLAVHKIEVREI